MSSKNNRVASSDSNTHTLESDPALLKPEETPAFRKAKVQDWIDDNEDDMHATLPDDVSRKSKGKNKVADWILHDQLKQVPSGERALDKNGKSPERSVDDLEMMDVSAEDLEPAIPFNWPASSAGVSLHGPAGLSLPDNSQQSEDFEGYETEPMDTRESPPRDANVGSVDPMIPAVPMIVPIFLSPGVSQAPGVPQARRTSGSPRRPHEHESVRRKPMPTIKPNHSSELAMKMIRDHNIRKVKDQRRLAKIEYEHLKELEALANQKRALQHSIQQKEQLLRLMQQKQQEQLLRSMQQKQQEQQEQQQHEAQPKKSPLPRPGKGYQMQLPLRKNPFVVDSVQQPELIDEHKKESKERRNLRKLRREERKRKREANDALQKLKGPPRPMDPMALACSECRGKLLVASRSRSILSLHVLCSTCQRLLYPNLAVTPPATKMGDKADADTDAATAAAEDSSEDSADDSDPPPAVEPQETQEPAKWSYAWFMSQLRLTKLRSQREEKQQKQQARVAHPAVARNAPRSSAPAVANASSSSGKSGKKTAVASAEASGNSGEGDKQSAVANDKASVPVPSADRKSRAAGGVRKQRAAGQPYGPNDPRLFRSRN